MPTRKVTPEVWKRVYPMYRAWEPGLPGSPSIDELVKPFGISKQAFYTELRRQGLPNRSHRVRLMRPAPSVGLDPTMRWLMDEVLAAKRRVTELERALIGAGAPVPAV